MMKNSKLIITSEIINALIDTKGGPINIPTLINLIIERTGVPEEEFGGHLYLVLFALAKNKFLLNHTAEKTGSQEIRGDTEFSVSSNWDDECEFIAHPC